MRDIKFRGKRIDNGEWAYGYYRITTPKYGVNIFAKKASLITDEKGVDYLVYPESVGQYTGLKDKNKKEIYEGSIIDMGGGVIAFVEWNNNESEYYFMGGCESPFREWRMHLMEIIGTKFDNPELLESK